MSWYLFLTSCQNVKTTSLCPWFPEYERKIRPRLYAIVKSGESRSDFSRIQHVSEKKKSSTFSKIGARRNFMSFWSWKKFLGSRIMYFWRAVDSRAFFLFLDARVPPQRAGSIPAKVEPISLQKFHFCRDIGSTFAGILPAR